MFPSYEYWNFDTVFPVTLVSIVISPYKSSFVHVPDAYVAPVDVLCLNVNIGTDLLIFIIYGSPDTFIPALFSVVTTTVYTPSSVNPPGKRV